ncbi:MAG: ribose-phosphate pyrophosphokinase [Cytophagales bacterium]|jgi:ribose-phosphate pyrophosphokinase|nr:ribose-phosphate pyrophosphokinase [Cytophagales bacterium]
MQTVVFALPGNENLAGKLASRINAEMGEVTIRQFPDKETYIRIYSDVKGKRVILVCTLNNPDKKLLPLYFLSQTAKALGADCTCLVAPYLAYMRQDKQFKPGEGITSTYFARFISNFADTLFTLDPHLHRLHSISEIYTVPCMVLHAAGLISAWIRDNIERPVLIGPDSESEQWVEAVAKNAGAPFIVLEKVRRGDREVEVTVPQVEKYQEHSPVLVDDIISTARTMIETIGHLKRAGMKPPICIGVHGIFAGNAFEELKAAGAGAIVTTNTICHPTNEIEIADLIASAL